MESPMELKAWPVFAKIKPDFLANVKSVSVYRDFGFEGAMILTNEDEVFGIGSNNCGRHGVGDTQPATNPRKVPALSNQQVVEISLGCGFALALTQDGTIYSWGKNEKGQLGRETTNDGLIPKPIEGPLRGKIVKSFACGDNHCLALTDSGEVFAWGLNYHGQLGDGSRINAKVPQKIQFEHLVPEGCHAQQISCGEGFSIILLNDGRILSFGYSFHGQLGHGNNENQSTPAIIEALRQTKIVSVSCGFAHVLALSDMGHLYSWGANHYGQSGNGRTENSSVPTRIGDKNTRFTAIETNWASRMSAALNESNQTYVWGECKGGEILTTPTETQYKSLPEAFYFHSYEGEGWSMYLRAIRFTSSGTSESQPSSSTCCSHCDDLVEQGKLLQLQLSTTQNAVAKLMEQVKLLQLRLSVTQNAVEATECKICYESHNGKPWVLVPCGHSGFCETCAKTFANESNGAGSRPMGCPFCRKQVVMTMQLHA